jgi:hypothetical protein
LYSRFAKIDPQSQRAYELAKQEGFVKPDVRSGTLIFQARCIKFEPPNFTIGKTINNMY